MSPALASAWPLDGALAVAWSALVLAWLVRAKSNGASAWRHPLLVFAATQLAIALAIGRARGGRGWLPDLGLHYASLSVALTVVLTSGTLLAAPRRGRLMEVFLIGFIALPYALSTTLAFRSPELAARVAEEEALERDIATGLPAPSLAARYGGLLQPGAADTPSVPRLASDLDRLRLAGWLDAAAARKGLGR